MKRIHPLLMLWPIGAAFTVIAGAMTLMTKLGLKKAPPEQYGGKYFW